IAQDAVRAISPEYIIRQAARLTLTFRRAYAHDQRLPDLPIPTAVKKDLTPTPASRKKDGQDPLEVKVATNAPAEQKKPAPPVELTANEVSIVIVTLPEKKQLDELIAKGNVTVFQAGDAPGQKRLDINGQLLTLRAGERGH